MAEANARLRSLNGGGSQYKSQNTQWPKHQTGLNLPNPIMIQGPVEDTLTTDVEHAVDIKTSLILVIPR